MNNRIADQSVVKLTSVRLIYLWVSLGGQIVVVIAEQAISLYHGIKTMIIMKKKNNYFLTLFDQTLHGISFLNCAVNTNILIVYTQ